MGEHLKIECKKRSTGEIQAWQSAICGSLAGGFSAAVTTPLDVAKTRIMLAAAGSKDAQLNTFNMLLLVAREKGLTGLFAGVAPRVTWISIGGAVFFGVYEKSKSVLAVEYETLP